MANTKSNPVDDVDVEDDVRSTVISVARYRPAKRMNLSLTINVDREKKNVQCENRQTERKRETATKKKPQQIIHRKKKNRNKKKERGCPPVGAVK